MTGRSVAGAGSGGRLCFASLPPRRRSTVAGSRPGALCSPRPPLPEGEEATRPRAGGGAGPGRPTNTGSHTPARARGGARVHSQHWRHPMTHPPARGEARDLIAAAMLEVTAPARARGSAMCLRRPPSHRRRTRPRAGKRGTPPPPPPPPPTHPPARGEARRCARAEPPLRSAPARARGKRPWHRATRGVVRPPARARGAGGGTEFGAVRTSTNSHPPARGGGQHH